jgi:hypothetical protein
MSSLGATTSQDGYILRQTIGQPSNTTAFNCGEIILLQGFQQPKSSRFFSFSFLPLDFTLSPNPAKDKTLLKFNEQITSYTITITSINGELHERIDEQTLLVSWLDFSNYLPGIYIVTVSGDKRIGSKKLIINP